MLFFRDFFDIILGSIHILPNILWFLNFWKIRVGNKKYKASMDTFMGWDRWQKYPWILLLAVRGVKSIHGYSGRLRNQQNAVRGWKFFVSWCVYACVWLCVPVFTISTSFHHFLCPFQWIAENRTTRGWMSKIWKYNSIFVYLWLKFKNVSAIRPNNCRFFLWKWK